MDKCKCPCCGAEFDPDTADVNGDEESPCCSARCAAEHEVAAYEWMAEVAYG
jgi:hypothetical protein